MARGSHSIGKSQKDGVQIEVCNLLRPQVLEGQTLDLGHRPAGQLPRPGEGHVHVGVVSEDPEELGAGVAPGTDHTDLLLLRHLMSPF